MPATVPVRGLNEASGGEASIEEQLEAGRCVMNKYAEALRKLAAS